jgi:DNA (cytosine-5)-methyltransferase 1
VGLHQRIPFGSPAKSRKTVRDTIARLPLAGSSGDKLHDITERRSARIKALIKKIPKDGGGRTDLPYKYQLDCHKRCNGFKDIYGRMAWDAVSPTITSGCFNPSKGRFLHPEEDRAITLREAALLQGFPHRYKFPITTNKSAVALMIGNALPPELIRRHAKSVFQTLITNGTANV